MKIQFETTEDNKVLVRCTTEEEKMALESHDWFFSYSDDHGVWRRGKDARNALIQNFGRDAIARIFDAKHAGTFAGFTN